MSPQVQRLTAFSTNPAGGNPAGVVLDATTLSDEAMQEIAAEVGFSETAFITSPVTEDTASIRYFAPEGEVDFCGHATVAAVVALGEARGHGRLVFETKVGDVEVSSWIEGEITMGSLHSPQLDCFDLPENQLEQLLETLGWSDEDLDPGFVPAVGYAGNRHPVLVVRDSATLGRLAYDFTALQRLCRAHRWVTVQLVAATGPSSWHSRNPFPWGGVIEDPATGAAAAALAAYLCAGGHARTGDSFVLDQGVEMGRPSRINVELLEDSAVVSGAVTTLDPAN